MKRDDSSYQIEAAAKCLKVLETLDEPIKIERVVNRTGFTYDYCRRALITLKLAGFAAQNERGEWLPGRRFIRLQLAVQQNF